MDRGNHFADHIQTLKQPPYSLEAEQAVIGGIILANHFIYDVVEILQYDDFYMPIHKEIFKAICWLSDQGKPVDIITTSEYLEKNPSGMVDRNALGYLAEIARNTPSVSNIKSYAKIVANRAVDRRIITAAQSVANAGFSRELETEEKIEMAEIALGSLRPEQRIGVEELNAVIKRTLNNIDLHSNDSEVEGIIYTGLTDLDQRFNGWRPSNLIIIAARPSMGKTVLALNIAAYNAIQKDIPVLFFSLEMPSEELMERMLSNYGDILLERIRNPKQFAAQDWEALSKGVSKIRDKELYIDSTPALSISELRARSRRIKREHPNLGLIVVDYLQLMRGEGDNREQEIASISRGLKSLAKELKLPVVALSQLNRGLESRPDKRPIMSDLRESGAIEQDADIITFLYRDEVYNEFSPEKGVAHAITRKFRNGKTGTDYLTEEFICSRFLNLAVKPEKFSDYGGKKFSGVKGMHNYDD